MNATASSTATANPQAFDQLWENYHLARNAHFGATSPTGPASRRIPLRSDAGAEIPPIPTEQGFLAATRNLRSFFAVLGVPVAEAFDDYTKAQDAALSGNAADLDALGAAQEKLLALAGSHPDLRSAVAHGALDLTAAGRDYWEINEVYTARSAASAHEVGQMARHAAAAAERYLQAILALADALGDNGESTSLRSGAKVVERAFRNYAATADRYGA